MTMTVSRLYDILVIVGAVVAVVVLSAMMVSGMKPPTRVPVADVCLTALYRADETVALVQGGDTVTDDAIRAYQLSRDACLAATGN